MFTTSQTGVCMGFGIIGHMRVKTGNNQHLFYGGSIENIIFITNYHIRRRSLATYYMARSKKID